MSNVVRIQFPQSHGSKVGLDDFFAQGNTTTDLWTHAAKRKADGWPEFSDAAEILKCPPPVRRELISGLLYAGSKAALVAPSKARKTFLQMHLCACIALGRPWLGHQTLRSDVLYINLELCERSFFERLEAILTRLGQSLPRNCFNVWHLRGRQVTIERLQLELEERLSKRNFGLICIDPLYKILGSRSENDATEIADLLGYLENVGHFANAAVLYAHHFSKGNASGKDILDRGSGSGVLARDGDAILTMTPHQDEDCFVLDYTLRDFAPIPSISLRWSYPVFEPDTSLSVADLKKARSAKPVPSAAILEQLTNEPRPKEEIVELVRKNLGAGINATREAFRMAVKQDLMRITIVKRPRTQPLKLYSRLIRLARPTRTEPCRSTETHTHA